MSVKCCSSPWLSCVDVSERHHCTFTCVMFGIKSVLRGPSQACLRHTKRPRVHILIIAAAMLIRMYKSIGEIMCWETSIREYLKILTGKAKRRGRREHTSIWCGAYPLCTSLFIWFCGRCRVLQAKYRPGHCNSSRRDIHYLTVFPICLLNSGKYRNVTQSQWKQMNASNVSVILLSVRSL